MTRDTSSETDRKFKLRKHRKKNLSFGSFEHAHSIFMRHSNQALSIYCYNLITSLQSAVSGRSAGWEDSFDVDWQVSMRTSMTTHDTETQALRAAFQLDDFGLQRSE